MKTLPYLSFSSYEGSIIWQFLDGVSTAVSNRMLRGSPPGEENLTFLLCELLDESSTGLHVLEYPLTTAKADLEKSDAGAWAFFVAGTRSMLVSQWKVNSASTSQLMMNFYQALASNRSSSVSKNANALREASLRLVREPQYRHPFYWAGFVMIGNGS